MKLLASFQLRGNGYTISSLHTSLKEEEIDILEKQELEWKIISVAEFKHAYLHLCNFYYCFPMVYFTCYHPHTYTQEVSKENKNI